MQSKINIKPLFFIISFFLVACGGGSSDSDGNNASDTTAPMITITGDNPVSVAQNTTYTDAGATAIDAVDGAVAVSSTGSVDISTVGSYSITYSATDAANNTVNVTRTVNVTDITEPVITISGDNPATVAQNTAYTDAGATAIDAVDGAVAVSSSGSVDTSSVGSYSISYTATDAANNTTSVIRTVNVVIVGSAELITSVGALGTTLTPGLVDVDGDGINDINFVSFGVDSGFLDASAPYGLVGNIGGSPGSGAAWVREDSDLVAVDGVGRNEIIADFRGAVVSSDDNWSKVHLSSGDGWVQWEFGATRDVVTPVVFVREGDNQNLQAMEAASLAYPPVVVTSGGALGTTLTPGLVDVDGDGINDIDFVSFGVDSGFLDASAPYGLVGNIGGSPGSGAAWVREDSDLVAVDGVGRNEIIADFRGALVSSDDNWSKVHLSSGDGWVQWEFGATRDVVTPVVFVREGDNQNLQAMEAASLAYPPVVVTSGGALGTTLTPGLVDVDGDGINDIDFVSFGVDSGFLDASAPYGLVGNIGGSPGSGAAWVREDSDLVAVDGVGRNEIIADFRGALVSSDDNWSKVHLSSGDGWVQWEFGATRDVVTPVVFVREGHQDLSAEEAFSLTIEPAVITSVGVLGTTLTPGLIDVDGDGISDINFVSFGIDSGFLDANLTFGLVGNIGGSPGTGAAWVRVSSDLDATDGLGRNEMIADFRGAVVNSDDNWSKVHLSSGDGWVQWEFGATRDVVTPVVFVREGKNQDLQAVAAGSLAYP